MAKRSPEERIDNEIEYLEVIEENNSLKLKLEEIKLYLAEQMKPISPSMSRVKTMLHVKGEVRQEMGNEILRIIEGKEE